MEDKKQTFEERYENLSHETLDTNKYWIHYEGSIRRHEPKIKMSKKERLKQRKKDA